MATRETVYLIRLNHLGFPEELRDLLASPESQKVGVAIRDDIKGLQQLGSFIPQGFVELSQLARQLGIVTCGLRNLAGIFLNVRISKKAQLSNWEQEELTESQQNYAATDAWISREIYGFLDQVGYRISQALNPDMEVKNNGYLPLAQTRVSPIFKPRTGLHPLVAGILYCRGYRTPDEVGLSATRTSSASRPFLLRHMQKR